MVEGIEQFDDIRPYEPEEMKQAFNDLIADRQFAVILKGLAPWMPKAVRNAALKMAFRGVKTPLDFQKRFMKPFVKRIIRKHTDGCLFDDSMLPHDKHDCRYTFVSNHRDIVLDSAFLDVKLIEGRYPTTVEIGIGDNLLIYPWIKRLVRMNKAFTVRRGLTPKEMLNSSQLMSRYIHFAVSRKKENIWIAQREGRAKDSDDRTQEAVLKMLAMAPPSAPASTASTPAHKEGTPASPATSTVVGGLPADSIRELNIVPLTITYEYDPCDYLKAQEMQQKRDNPSFKKSRQDDLDNMRTGIFGYKGRVFYRCGRPVNEWLDELRHLPRKDFFKTLAERMDSEIHLGYEPLAVNYIALDECEGTGTYADKYSDEEKAAFDRYIDAQLTKVTIDNPDTAFLRQRMLEMYANPCRNRMAALDKQQKAQQQ